MKNFLLLISFVLIAHLTQCQDYIPLLEGNPIWKVYGIDNSQISEDSNTNIEYRLEDDTLIDGMNYRVLKIEKAESSYAYPFITEAYLRENTETRQVFIRFKDEDQELFGDNEELMLYDFSLSAGDSFELYEDFDGNEVNILIDTVYTIDGEERTARITDFPSTGSETEKIYVEGIGFLSDLLMPVFYNEFVFYNSLIYCYSNSSEGIVQEFEYSSVPEDYDCESVLSSSAIPVDQQLAIYPNPSQEEVFIELTDLNKISITNLLGQVIYKDHQIKRNRIKINNAEWVEGLYLVRACDGSNNCGVKRMIVKH
jgi:hypothetical protein